ncbi:alpha-beta hydrolase superfamily lysophospholipase [Amycolatopsis sulphurea]|uniref:Alpha-beta hydrolase superfamily lysophospholipase n=1 Tax=Amycolatopsis sulphurea TaxID=76022 RepID=A0A2A9FDX1_9PSEU|nr:alpha/beta fold hydrolase [Amycolatopsis sulphurea]PFG49647.1 alpha-beta hydrolase superfamily lysophospholipase [Amycolatopsis sulphurea]
MPFFDSPDARLYFRAWEVDEPVAGFVFLHGGGEHSGQFSRLASRLNAAGIDVWAIDHQGHGISGGERGVVRSLDVLARDALALADLVRERRPGLPLVIGGHSLGGWTTALVVTKNPDLFVGAVLTGASLRGRTAVGQPAPGDPFRFDISLLAADPDYLEELRKDPLVQLVLPEPEATAAALAVAAEDLATAFPTVSLPVLLVNGTDDALASIEDARYWRERLPDARLVEIGGGLHNVLNDVDHVEAITAVRDFVLERV